MTFSKDDILSVEKPDNKLREKVRILSLQPGSEDKLITKATETVEELKSEFPDWLKQEINSLLILKQQFQEKPNDSKVLKDIFNTVHNLRGMASTFGHPYIGHSAESLCKVFEARDEKKFDFPPHLLTLHIDTMVSVYKQNIGETKNEIADELIKNLQAFVKKFIDDLK